MRGKKFCLHTNVSGLRLGLCDVMWKIACGVTGLACKVGSCVLKGNVMHAVCFIGVCNPLFGGTFGPTIFNHINKMSH